MQPGFCSTASYFGVIAVCYSILVSQNASLSLHRYVCKSNDTGIKSVTEGTQMKYYMCCRSFSGIKMST